MKKTVSIFLLSVAVLVAAGCHSKPREIRQLTTNSDNTQRSKSIILLIVDSLMDKQLQDTIKEGNAPALAFLMNRGRYVPKVVSAFPTMSVTIDSTLLTGSNPDRHHIPGLVWYNSAEKRIVNYGTGLRETMKLGPSQVLMDSLIQLNSAHLSPKVVTVHEAADRMGKKSASINALIYRGTVKHRLQVPATIASVTSLPKELDTMGPALFSLGRLAMLDPSNRKHAFAWNKYGLTDTYSAKELKFLIKERRLPDLTVVYFPSNDHRLHRKGPDAHQGIQKADEQLQSVLSAFGTWEKALQNTVWIVLGDSGQSHIDAEREKSVIDLNRMLGDYKLTRLRDPVTEQDQIVLCVNERMAYIYALKADPALPKLAERLQQDSRIDIIAWKEDGRVKVVAGGKKEALFFSRNGKYRDVYNQKWSLDGDPSLLDISISEADGFIRYNAYPDGLQRLHDALHSHSGDFLVVTAKPEYEFVGESSPTHLGGGGHGSLHMQDSLVPLIVTGTDSNPSYWRIVDLKEWIMKMLK